MTIIQTPGRQRCRRRRRRGGFDRPTGESVRPRVAQADRDEALRLARQLEAAERKSKSSGVAARRGGPPDVYNSLSVEWRNAIAREGGAALLHPQRMSGLPGALPPPERGRVGVGVQLPHDRPPPGSSGSRFRLPGGADLPLSGGGEAAASQTRLPCPQAGEGEEKDSTPHDSRPSAASPSAAPPSAPERAPVVRPWIPAAVRAQMDNIDPSFFKVERIIETDWPDEHSSRRTRLPERANRSPREAEEREWEW